jgi:Ankyrin repeats (many copies)
VQACKAGHVQHVEQLLFYGAEMNQQNAGGNTPLHICAINNQVPYDTYNVTNRSRIKLVKLNECILTTVTVYLTFLSFETKSKKSLKLERHAVQTTYLPLNAVIIINRPRY